MVSITESEFDSNSATYGTGGAVFCAAGPSPGPFCTIKDSEFTNNASGDRGSAINVDSTYTQTYVFSVPEFTLAGSTFVDNKANSGIAVERQVKLNYVASMDEYTRVYCENQNVYAGAPASTPECPVTCANFGGMCAP